MGDFKVSIIIPVYNREKYIERAINSCVNLPQTGEVLVIDDGSTDNSKQIIKNIAKKNSIIKYITHPDKKNHGRSASRNLGIINAKCEYISFLDSDDWYLPTRFQYEENIFSKDSTIAGVYGIVEVKFENDIAKEKYYNRFESNIIKVSDNISHQNLYKTFICGGYGEFQTNAITIKKYILNKIGLFPKNLDVCEDTHLWARITSKYKIVSNNNKLPISIQWVHQDNSIINNPYLWSNSYITMNYSLFKWALKQNDFEYDKKNDFFIGYKKLIPNENNLKTFTKFIIKNPKFLFNKYTIRKFVQLLKNPK